MELGTCVDIFDVFDMSSTVIVTDFDFCFVAPLDVMFDSEWLLSTP